VRTKSSKKVGGAQSLRRAISILHAVAQAGKDGCRTTQVVAEVGLNRATTDRILRALLQAHLLERQGPQKGYRIGPEIIAWAAAARQHLSYEERFDGLMAQVAESTGDTVFLTIRSGEEAICVARQEGHYPIRALPFDVGSRRPLGVGAGPLAILAFLQPAEAQIILQKNSLRYAKFGLTGGEVSKMVERSRSLGYALNDGRVIPEMSGVGVPVRNFAGEVVGAVSIAAINARMSVKRRAELARDLQAKVSQLGPVG
jgi:DNA-binding IclR family transcriptional regulator